MYYTTNVLPVPGPVYLTTHVYDKYPNWIGALPQIILGQGVRYNHTQKPKGMETAVYLKALDVSGNTATSRSYTLYDSKLRPVRSYTENYLGGYTRSDMKYDFVGNVLKTETYHKRTAADNELETEENFSYTDEDWLLEHTHKINGLPAETLSHKEYDALGQLVVKKVGNIPKSPLQHIDYKYNIRGWLTDINNVHNLAPSGQPQDLFAFRINYNTVTQAHPDVEPLYNGNISQTFWRTANDNILRSYGYVYDPLNRLLDAQYKIPGSSVNNSYNEHLTYDRNGNILSLKRNGRKETEQLVFMIDNLDYKYDGNRLINVTDSTDVSYGFNDGNKHVHTGLDDFEYDAYGNMIVDRNKKITNITYNHLNLPKKITFENNRSIEYIYGGDGVKLKKTVTEGTTNKTVDYLDGYQYEEGKINFFPTSEGYVQVILFDSGDYSYHYVYNYTDHLGNIRVRYTKDPQTGTIKPLEENHYYPFACPVRSFRGLKHQGYNHDHQVLEFDPIEGNVALITIPQNATDGYHYKYNGKEHQDELGLDWYDYGARNYQADLGRWMNVDPLAERHPEASPYAYVLNNPIYYIDPDGRTEYPSYAAYKKALGSSALSRQDMWKQGHWLYSDRMYHPNSWSGAVTRRSSVFNNAAALNTANGRSGDYTNLGQRKAYYGWAEEFYQDKGYGVKWFTAAKNVVGSLEDALDYGGIGRVITGGSYGTNDRINSFIKAGNQVILDDVIGRISDLASGGVLTGADAKAWDSQTLSNEQNAIQPLYGSMLTSGDIDILNNNVELNYGDNWDSSWSVSNQSHRWALGMRVMGYEGTKPEDMPKPTN